MRVFNNIWKSAALLGVLALASEALIAGLSTSTYFHVGLLFVFIAAFSLGVQATAVTATFLILPLAVLQTGWGWALETYFVVLSSAWVCQRWAKIPIFLPVTAAWLIVIAVQSIALAFGVISSIDHMYLLAGVLGNSCLALIAGTLLLHPDISALLHRRPKRFSAHFIAMHLATLFACVVFGLAIMLIGSSISFPIERVVAELDPLFALIVAATLFGALPLLTVKLLPHVERKNDMQRGSWYNETSADLSSSPTPPIEESAGEQNRSQWLTQDSPKSLISTPERAVVVLDGRTRVSFTNAYFIELIGAENAKVLGKEISELPISEAMQKALLDAREQTLQFGPGVNEFLCQEGKKQRFFEIASVLPPRSSGAEQSSVIFTITEITERRTLEAHLLQAQRAHSLSSVVANAAHALNNNLTTIIGHASMKMVSSDHDETKSTLSVILEQAHAAGKLIWKILDLVEDKGDLKKKVELNSELQELHSALQSFAGSDYSISLNDCTDSLWISGDSSLLMQALTNLVLNSREAYQETRSGLIEISLERELIDREVAHLHPGSRPGEFARIRVRDWGVGMSADVLRRAFEPLFSTKGQRGQSGLGLSTAYAIVRAHGGFLSIESQPNKGTSVSLYFPLVEGTTSSSKDSTQKETSLASTENGHKKRKGRILVVEDEPTVRTLIEKMISTLGYDVSSCEGGALALESCRGEDFDLVLVDMMMPQMSGEEFIKTLSSEKPEVPTVIMTGLIGGSTEDSLENSILAKPFDLTTLANAIERRLEQNNAQSRP